MPANYRPIILRFIILLAVLSCVGSVLWSLWFETLLLHLGQGKHLFAILELGGFFVCVLGVGCMAYSASIIVRNTNLLFANPRYQTNMQIVRHRKQYPSESVREARKDNLRLLWSAWCPGFPWMALGWLIFAIGGWLIRLAEGRLLYW